MIVKYNVGSKTLLGQHEQGMSGLVFCGDLFCEFKGTVGCFSNSGFWGEDLTDGVATNRSWAVVLSLLTGCLLFLRYVCFFCVGTLFCNAVIDVLSDFAVVWLGRGRGLML